MILLDTSALIGVFSEPARLRSAYSQALLEGYQLVTSTLVLFEWLRGPRGSDELAAVRFAFPPTKTIAFGVEEAVRAAVLYRTVSSPRRREMDLAIAATAMVWEAEVWTMNPDDFRGIPGLRLFTPSTR